MQKIEIDFESDGKQFVIYIIPTKLRLGVSIHMVRIYSYCHYTHKYVAEKYCGMDTKLF